MIQLPWISNHPRLYQFSQYRNFFKSRWKVYRHWNKNKKSVSLLLRLWKSVAIKACRILDQSVQSPKISACLSDMKVLTPQGLPDDCEFIIGKAKEQKETFIGIGISTKRCLYGYRFQLNVRILIDLMSASTKQWLDSLWLSSGWSFI